MLAQNLGGRWSAGRRARGTPSPWQNGHGYKRTAHQEATQIGVKKKFCHDRVAICPAYGVIRPVLGT